MKSKIKIDENQAILDKIRERVFRDTAKTQQQEDEKKFFDIELQTMSEISGKPIEEIQKIANEVVSKENQKKEHKKEFKRSLIIRSSLIVGITAVLFGITMVFIKFIYPLIMKIDFTKLSKILSMLTVFDLLKVLAALAAITVPLIIILKDNRF